MTNLIWAQSNLRAQSDLIDAEIPVGNSQSDVVDLGDVYNWVQVIINSLNSDTEPDTMTIKTAVPNTLANTQIEPQTPVTGSLSVNSFEASLSGTSFEVPDTNPVKINVFTGPARLVQLSIGGAVEVADADIKILGF